MQCAAKDATFAYHTATHGLDLKDVNFVTLTIDSSNRKEIKLTPVCVRYFNQNVGIKVKLLYFDQLPGETSDILVEHHLKCIKKYSIDSKVVCLYADNTNTNFGGVKRKGQGNVFRKLQKSLSRPIFELVVRLIFYITLSRQHAMLCPLMLR